MPIDEPLDANAQRCVGIVDPVLHLVRDVLGQIEKPVHHPGADIILNGAAP
jgi:hypothetical protein